jgi:hypothetical protein
MAGRGVVFALTADDEAALLAADGDADAVLAEIEAIEERWDVERLAETDKAWDAIHRALTDGDLAWENGTAPLNRTILGGRRLSAGDDYIAIYKTAQEVADVAAALATIDEEAILERYRQLVPVDYAPEYGEDDAAYTAEWYAAVRTLYATAAREGLSALFTVSE